MSNLANPLQSIIDQAASLDTKQTKGSRSELERHAQRINVKTSGISVILLDISASMAEVVGSKTKIEILRDALARPLQSHERVISFSSTATSLPDLQSIPHPFGSTALDLGLIEAAKFSPSHTLVVSDGHPDDERAALAAAKVLSGQISTLFIGAEDDTKAIDFMRKLARLGCGHCDVYDIRKEQHLLFKKIQLLLPSVSD